MRFFNRYVFALTTGIILSASTLRAQELEFGAWGGLTHSFGDINNSLKSMQFLEPGAGVFFRYNLDPRLAYYIGLSGGQTLGYDSISSNVYQLRRNLSYRTTVYDLTARIDFNFLPLEREKPNHWFTPYVFLGLGVYYFNPQAYYNDEWVDLQPLGTEGQQFPELTGNDKYSRVQVNVPIGGGLKVALSKNITTGIEWNWHLLFTDYFDDVSTTYVDPSILASGADGALAVALADRSTAVDITPLGEAGKQRGDFEHRDKYLYTGIFLSYTIVDLKCPSPGRWGAKF